MEEQQEQVEEQEQVVEQCKINSYSSNKALAVVYSRQLCLCDQQLITVVGPIDKHRQ